MYSTSRVTSSSSISSISAVACGGMVSSLVAADRRTARVSRLGQICVRSVSSLQVAIHEVDLLQSAQALADVLRPDLPHALARLQFGVAGAQQLIQAAELAHDPSDRQSRQPRDAPQHPVAARRDGVVERVQLAVVPKQLGEPPEVE